MNTVCRKTRKNNGIYPLQRSFKRQFPVKPPMRARQNEQPVRANGMNLSNLHRRPAETENVFRQHRPAYENRNRQNRQHQIRRNAPSV